MTTEAITPLLQRRIEDMNARKLGAHSQRSHIYSCKRADGRDIVLVIMHEGDVFGEIALLDGHPRTADASAMTDCELMLIDRRHFLQFVRSQPDLMIKIMEILCARLRRTPDQVQELTFLNLASRLAKALLRLTDEAQASAPARKVAITQ